MRPNETLIYKLIESFEYKSDRRNPPDAERQAKFKSGWTKALDNNREDYSKETLLYLTWDNLGYRLGHHFGEMSLQDRDQIYKYCALHWQQTDINAWLVINKKDTKLVGDGYEDIVDKVYSWDDTVANSSRIQKGDALVLFDSNKLLGYGIIHELETWTGEKTRYRCPNCEMCKVIERRKKEQRYRCDNCKSRFNDPKKEQISVKKFRAVYEHTWVDLNGELDGSQLRLLCESPKSQHSLRPFKWREFVGKLPLGLRNFVKKTPNVKDGEITGGHQRQMVRVRKGQASFRAALLDHFGTTCAFSGSTSKLVLDAAHLYSFAKKGIHEKFGGLLMRKDLHRLFDLGLIRVNPSTFLIQVDKSLLHIPIYNELNTNTLAVEIPKETQRWLQIHWDEYGSEN